MIETSHVDAMIAIRGNFFYTRTVPCELWFLNKDKPEEMKGKVLMVDARNTFRKVTRKIYDFSPEQTQNLTAIFWLYRGQQERFLDLIAQYLQATVGTAQGTAEAVSGFFAAYDALAGKMDKVGEEVTLAHDVLKSDIDAFTASALTKASEWENADRDNSGLAASAEKLEPLADTSRDLTKQIDQVFKLIEKRAKDQSGRGLNKLIKETDEVRRAAVEALRQVRYFHKQTRWLQERFPDAELQNVEGLVKLVDHAELEENDWSLTPGRYVGVAPEEEDEDFDFEEALRDIHLELAVLNEEAGELTAQIQRNFEELGV